MKNKLLMCDNCKEITVHSVHKHTSPTRQKLKREVDRCNQCGRRIIKSQRMGTRTISGQNEKPQEDAENE